MKAEKVARNLTGLTSNLVSLFPENEPALESVRRVLGFNLRNNRQDIPSIKLPTIELDLPPSKEKIQEFKKYAVSKLSEDDRVFVKRIGGKEVIPAVGVRMGDFRLPINPLDVSGENRWHQKFSEQVGPFLSEQGRTVWFDLYYYEAKLTVRSQNGKVPHFLFSKVRRNQWFSVFNLSQTVSLKAGQVWLLAKLFNNAAGNQDYVGLNIKGGSFSISNDKVWNGQTLDFVGGFSGKLTVQLVQPAEISPLFEGCSAAQDIAFHYPDEVTFEWENGQLTGIASDQGDFSGYGNALTFTNFNTSTEYPAGLNHIFIPCQVEPNTWQVDFSQSQLFFPQANTNADIQRAYWALPVVRVSNPDTLGEPENNGGWGLRLSTAINAHLLGSDQQQPDAVLTDALLLLYPLALLLYSDKTTVEMASVTEIKQNFACWQISLENAALIPLALTYLDTFLFMYYCHATEGETLMAGCSGQMQPDRPVFADGSHMLMQDLKGLVAFQARGPEIKISALLGNNAALQKTPKPLALENALMILSQPTGLILEGLLAAQDPNRIEKGRVTLLLPGPYRWKPILPDPYVSNLNGGWRNNLRKAPGGDFFPHNNLGVPQISSILSAQIRWEQPALPVVTFKGDLPLSAGVGIKTPGQPTIQALPVKLDERALAEIREHAISGEQRENKDQIGRYFDQIEAGLSGWRLLDVSTNMDLIGVSVSPGLYRGDRSRLVLSNPPAQPASADFVVKEMAVNTPLSWVHVFTVPQVQWEPVRTLPEDQNLDTLGWFPENLSSASDGGPTRLLGTSQELSPIIPDVVIHQIQDSFKRGNLAIALTTLSFGLKAFLQLLPRNTAVRNADSIDLVQPEFTQKKMKGGIQINLMAEAGNPKSESHSPGFEGSMAQILNGYELFTGTELGLSVLGATKQSDASVETQFNKEFSISSVTHLVPVTRLDLSGYGASNFSEWENPGALASIGKVQFKIMVGRTAFEVVKFVSKMYPYGPTVTRSVTIERRSGGGVVRKDTGWETTQAGIFDFRAKDIPVNPYTFKPGIFRGCFDIKNIRPASNDTLKFTDPANGNPVELAPVYFDANVQIDGQVDGTVFSRGILGFIQLEPKPDKTADPWVPRLLSVAAFRKLVIDQGAIGGPIDTMLNIGNSGFQFRATRFEVDVTDNAGTPNFVGVGRGQPVLPNNGAWSVVKMAAPGNTADPQEAVSADVSRGTPLFIENTWNPPTGAKMDVSGPGGPYRFADPADLFTLQPRFDYGFMQNTGTQAFLFRRPVIVPGTNELSSNLKPAFADPFAMLTSKGVFPPIANAVEFPSSNYKLLVQPATGKLQLSAPLNFHNLRPPLVVARDGADQIAIEYDQSDLRINLNYDDWNIELDNFFIWTTLLGISKLSGTRFSLRAGTARQTRLVNVQALFMPELYDALKFLPGMEGPADIGDIDLGMTNAKHEVKIHTGFNTPNLIPDPIGDWLELKFSGNAGVDSAKDTEDNSWLATFGASVSVGLQGKPPVGGIVFIAFGLEMEVGLGSSVSPTTSSSVEVGFKSFKTVEISTYVGVGIGGKVGPFKAEAFLAAGLVFIYEDNTAKFGGLVMFEAEVSLKKIISVSLSAELKGVAYQGDDPDTGDVETDVTLIDASGEVAINISIFLIITIDASYSYQTILKP